MAEITGNQHVQSEVLEGLALKSDDFNEDIHATRAYRENLVRVMAKRAVAKLAKNK